MANMTESQYNQTEPWREEEPDMYQCQNCKQPRTNSEPCTCERYMVGSGVKASYVSFQKFVWAKSFSEAASRYAEELNQQLKFPVFLWVQPAGPDQRKAYETWSRFRVVEQVTIKYVADYLGEQPVGPKSTV